jgi:predicted dehydrogenase
MKTSLVVGMGIGKLYEKILQEMGHGVITVDPDPSKGADFKDLDEAIRECILFDDVYICTPNYTHIKIARKLASVARYVFVEKPGVANADAWSQLVLDYPRTRFMMVKNNMWRDNIEEMRAAAKKANRIHINWINKDRVPNPGSWFTTKALAYGGVSRDLMPHLLSLYIALNPSWRSGRTSSNTGYRRWNLDDLTQSDYGSVNANGIYDVDDVATITFDNKWTLTANWRDTVEDNRKVICDDVEFELGLCPESAYKAMIQDAIDHVDDHAFWAHQYEQDMWIHDRIQLWM